MMTINKRTGIGAKGGIVAAATVKAKIVFRSGEEWFIKDVADRADANAERIGNADAAFVTADGKKIVCIDGELKIV